MADEAPAPSPTPAIVVCANPNVPPKTLAVAPVKTVFDAQGNEITGEVIVIISLDENSRQITPPIIQRSSNALLNQAAIDAAAQSRFQTAIRRCKPRAGSFRFVVEFLSNATPAPSPSATSGGK